MARPDRNDRKRAGAPQENEGDALPESRYAQIQRYYRMCMAWYDLKGADKCLRENGVDLKQEVDRTTLWNWENKIKPTNLNLLKIIMDRAGVEWNDLELPTQRERKIASFSQSVAYARTLIRPKDEESEFTIDMIHVIPRYAVCFNHCVARYQHRLGVDGAAPDALKQDILECIRSNLPCKVIRDWTFSRLMEFVEAWVEPYEYAKSALESELPRFIGEIDSNVLIRQEIEPRRRH